MRVVVVLDRAACFVRVTHQLVPESGTALHIRRAATGIRPVAELAVLLQWHHLCLSVSVCVLFCSVAYGTETTVLQWEFPSLSSRNDWKFDYRSESK